MVGNKNTVKVINFVLDNSRAHTVRFHYELVTFRVKSAYRDLRRAGDVEKDAWYTQTAFFLANLFLTNPLYYRVDQNSNLIFWVGAANSDSLKVTELCRSKANTSRITHDLLHPLNLNFEFLVETINGKSGDVKDRIAVLTNFV